MAGGYAAAPVPGVEAPAPPAPAHAAEPGGFKSFASAERFCRSYDELRNFLRPRTRHNQHVPANRRRLLHLRRATTALAILEAA